MTEPLTLVDQLGRIMYDDGSNITNLASSTVYGTFSSSHFLCIDALKGRQYLQPRIVQVQRTISPLVQTSVLSLAGSSLASLSVLHSAGTSDAGDSKPHRGAYFSS
jgi:hypothetical protein